MDKLRNDILLSLKHSDRLTPSDIHRRLNGAYTTADIESEMIAMDLDGVITNDLVPMAKITARGRKLRGDANAS